MYKGNGNQEIPVSLHVKLHVSPRPRPSHDHTEKAYSLSRAPVTRQVWNRKGKLQISFWDRERVSQSVPHTPTQFFWKYPPEFQLRWRKIYQISLTHAYTLTETRGVLPEKIGWGCAISDQNLWLSLPYFRPVQEFDTLFQTWRVTGARDKLLWQVHTRLSRNIKTEMALSPYNEELASSKNIPNSRLECTNHTLFQTKMVKTDTLFHTKTANKPYPLAPHIPI